MHTSQSIHADEVKLIKITQCIIIHKYKTVVLYFIVFLCCAYSLCQRLDYNFTARRFTSYLLEMCTIGSQISDVHRSGLHLGPCFNDNLWQKKHNS